MLGKLKKVLIGDALPDWEYKHQRLSKKIALAIFSSDAISSVAYSAEEIAIVLITAGSAALFYSLPIALAIIFLLWALIFSYRQTIEAYPKGAGSYTVAMENLGPTMGLMAASSLLLDYILTVSVSVAAGVAAVTSAFPALFPERVIIGVVVILFIMIMNLKGVKESGKVFALPIYLFLVSYFAMLIVGFYRFFTGTLQPTIIHEQVEILSSLSIFLILKAFSGGCTALTGVEAISNGIQAFQKPESKNAKATLLIMGILITFLVFGTSFIGVKLGVQPLHNRTFVSLIAENLFGRTFFYFIIQAVTMMILFLAANTSFQDFPRLCYFHARDGYMPRQFTQLGDRLVFSNGIIFLAAISSFLIILFQGTVHLLIPLYAVGVFLSFSLSQAGMIKRHLRLKKEHWRKSIVINGIGFVLSTIVLVITLITKFLHGAWVIVILIVVLNITFKKIKEHYTNVSEQLSLCDVELPLKKEKRKHMMLVLVPTLHKGILQAISYAKDMCKDVRAVHINISKAGKEKLMERWHKYVSGVDLVTLDSPYRILVGPLMKYIDELEAKDKDIIITVVITEFVPIKWWQHILHNQTAFALKAMIHFRKRTNYISLQYHLEK